MLSSVNNPEMVGMEFGVVSMGKHDVFNFCYPEETVFDLLFGEVIFEWEGRKETVNRKCCFHDGAVLLHVPSNVHVAVSCLSEKTEVAVMHGK